MHRDDVTLIVAAADALVLDALCALFVQHGLSVLDTAKDGQEAPRKVRALQPSLVLVEQYLPTLNGADAAMKTVREPGETRPVLLCRTPSRTVHRAIRFGVPGCICVADSADIAVRAMTTVASGGKFVCPELASMGSATQLDSLTPREIEVLQLVAEGKRTKEIALLLRISSKTVEHYRSRLAEKLDAHNVSALIRVAIGEGLVAVHQNI